MIKNKLLGIIGAGFLLSLTLFQTKANAADYTVISNDSLYKIGLLFDTDATALKTNNSLSSDIIYPGQILDVPAITYQVKKGDSLYLIAKEHNVLLELLRKANSKWDDMIYPGDTLLIPSVESTASALLQDTTSTKSKTTSSTKTQESTTPTSKKAVVSYTEEEVDLLARLITAEATGQPYDAMVAVGAVVINRVKSDEWPSTITTVINHVAGQYYQFTPVKNGYIKRAATDTAIKAAWDALYGVDPSNGALFYFDDSSTNEWLWQKTIKARIGNMVYVK